MTLGGSDSTYAHSLRFTFRITSVNSSYSTYPPVLLEIRAYGTTGWSNSNSNMGINEHLYSWDYKQNATFPAQVKTSSTPLEDTDLTNKTYVDKAVAKKSLTGQLQLRLLSKKCNRSL